MMIEQEEKPFSMAAVYEEDGEFSMSWNNIRQEVLANQKANNRPSKSLASIHRQAFRPIALPQRQSLNNYNDEGRSLKCSNGNSLASSNMSRNIANTSTINHDDSRSVREVNSNANSTLPRNSDRRGGLSHETTYETNLPSARHAYGNGDADTNNAKAKYVKTGSNSSGRAELLSQESDSPPSGDAEEDLTATQKSRIRVQSATHSNLHQHQTGKTFQSPRGVRWVASSF